VPASETKNWADLSQRRRQCDRSRQPAAQDNPAGAGGLRDLQQTGNLSMARCPTDINGTRCSLSGVAGMLSAAASEDLYRLGVPDMVIQRIYETCEREHDGNVFKSRPPPTMFARR
jgi:hypothetical protein